MTKRSLEHKSGFGISEGADDLDCVDASRKKPRLDQAEKATPMQIDQQYHTKKRAHTAAEDDRLQLQVAEQLAANNVDLARKLEETERKLHLLSDMLRTSSQHNRLLRAENIQLQSAVYQHRVSADAQHNRLRNGGSV